MINEKEKTWTPIVSDNLRDNLLSIILSRWCIESGDENGTTSKWSVWYEKYQ